MIDEMLLEMEKLGWPAQSAVLMPEGGMEFRHSVHRICIKLISPKGMNPPAIPVTAATMRCTHLDARGIHKIKPIRIDTTKAHWRKHLTVAYTVMVMKLQELSDVYAERDRLANEIQRKRQEALEVFCAPVGIKANEFNKVFRTLWRSDDPGHLFEDKSTLAPWLILSNTHEKSALLFKHLKDNGWMSHINFTSNAFK